MSNKMLFQQFFIVACNQSKSFHIMFREQRYTFPERRHIFVGYFHRTLPTLLHHDTIPHIKIIKLSHNINFFGILWNSVFTLKLNNSNRPSCCKKIFVLTV